MGEEIDDIETFNYTTIGRSIYSLIEEYNHPIPATSSTTTTTTTTSKNGTTTTMTHITTTNSTNTSKTNVNNNNNNGNNTISNPMIITLQPPKCVGGIAHS